MKFTYPIAHQEPVIENYHGTLVADPYRWLENSTAQETKTFIAEQNALTQQYLADAPNRGTIIQRLQTLWNFPKFSTPYLNGDRYFFSKNDGLQNQPILYQQVGQEQPTILLDPNPLSSDGTIAVMSQSFNKDASLLAYSLSQSGSDRQVIKVLDTTTGKHLPDEIRWCRFTNVAWSPDSKGFFYNRYPQPGTVAKEDETNYSQVYYHALGTQQADDTLVHHDPLNKLLGFSPEVFEDGKILVLTVYLGTDKRNGLYYRPLDSSKPFTKLFEHAQASYHLLGIIGNTWYIHTDLDAPKGRVIAFDLAHPEPLAWREVLPESEFPIDIAQLVNQMLVVVHKEHVQHKVHLYSLEGMFQRELTLPAIGSILSMVGTLESKALFLVFQSFIHPPTILRYDFDAGELHPQHEVNLPYHPEDYETTQVFYPSKDGTHIPMFLTARKGFRPTGETPTILYGYGGFNISQPPMFTLARLAWVEQGGLFALANLRGGEEYGEAWHQAGMLDRKQNVFDDFIAAAEWLIANGYTTKSHLAIEGRSNGGLLTGACMLQRPELFGAVLSHVGVHDMLRYHKFTVGRYWTPEYGNAEENPDHFRFIFPYSPLHNVRPGVSYPPILLTTADTDDRVVPMHSLKFTATLQANSLGTSCSWEHPILLRVETSAGHGLGKPTAKIIEELADILCFLDKNIH